LFFVEIREKVQQCVLPAKSSQYISGKKKASKARMNLIFETIHEIGWELVAV
jgi:hypothetical protein